MEFYMLQNELLVIFFEYNANITTVNIAFVFNHQSLASYLSFSSFTTFSNVIMTSKCISSQNSAT